MITAGKFLRVVDAADEGTTGEVVLETTQAFSTVGFMVLVDYNHLGGNSDTGFNLELGVRFQFDNLKDLVFRFPKTETYDVSLYYRDFPVGPYKIFYPIPMSVRNSYTRLFFKWNGAFDNLSDLTLHFLPDSL